MQTTLKISLLLLIASNFSAQERTVDPTWLHRYVPSLAPEKLTAGPGCQYKPVFGEGDRDGRILRSVERFGELSVDPRANCNTTAGDREEEIDFVLEGEASLLYGEHTYAMHANDFTYVTPGAKHSLQNNSDHALRVLVMRFKIPTSVAIAAQPTELKIVNLDNVKEETVGGHPTSVLYRLLAGPRTGTRDAIDQAYVVVSFFLMDFAPGGTNFPHHHETAEEIYLVLDGQGEMVAGSGMDGVEGRFPAKAGDAYYFRANCTVGFYNEDKPGAKAHILAVRSKIPLPKDED